MESLKSLNWSMMALLLVLEGSLYWSMTVILFDWDVSPNWSITGLDVSTGVLLYWSVMVLLLARLRISTPINGAGLVLAGCWPPDLGVVGFGTS